jgi:hypothetical protein
VKESSPDSPVIPGCGKQNRPKKEKGRKENGEENSSPS